jgi:hypothetical protein
MKIRPVKAELFHADRRTDGETEMTKLIVAFRNIANAPKNWQSCIQWVITIKVDANAHKEPRIKETGILGMNK